jgi:hypothetical protein
MNLETTMKKQLIVATATLLASIATWIFFTGPASAKVSAIQQKLDTAENEFVDAERKANNLARLENEYSDLQARLKESTERLVDGDKYLWVIRNFAKYQVPSLLEFTGFDQPVESDWGLSNNANPLKAATFLVKGLGSYQELGKFTAALENDYPGLRFRSVTIWPHEPLTQERVAFVLEVVGLLSPQPQGARTEPTHLLTSN